MKRISRDRVINYFSKEAGNNRGQYQMAMKYAGTRYLYRNARMNPVDIARVLNTDIKYIRYYLNIYKPQRWYKEFIANNFTRLVLNDIYLVSKRKGKKRIYSYVEKHLDELH
jgi:hypothetical protein